MPCPYMFVFLTKVYFHRRSNRNDFSFRAIRKIHCRFIHQNKTEKKPERVETHGRASLQLFFKILKYFFLTLLKFKIMQAIEFETYVNHRAIQIPMQYQLIDNAKVKVILLYSEPEKKGNYDKQLLLQTFAKAQEKGVFKQINNSVTWQKQQRDEWE